MKPKFEALRLPAAISLALTLAACGGGGGGDTPPPPPPPACNGIQIVADANVASGKVAGASALSCGQPLKSVVWSQVSGTSVALNAAATPTVAIETAGQVGRHPPQGRRRPDRQQQRQRNDRHHDRQRSGCRATSRCVTTIPCVLQPTPRSAPGLTWQAPGKR
ncbi:hypothetical protein LP420_09210 [Massilia sp. B-10]|nr:hypothetical protein LP420_09210 [Massilia sp. B-10]